jgi:pimeloyl-ACP methyl ester carboxylesterase
MGATAEPRHGKSGRLRNAAHTAKVTVLTGRTAMVRYSLRGILAVAAAFILLPEIAAAQSRPELIPVPGRIKMALYRPDSGPAPTVAIIVMHRTSNYLTHRACTELSRRGFLMLCMNSRFENNEPAVDFEQLPLDVKGGVEFLRKQPGITKIVLFGHSGGGPIMALYQAVAEKGIGYCQSVNKLTQCPNTLAGLPPIDGIVFTDTHPGNAINLLRGINPSVANENNPPDAPPVAALDPFNPANGFNPSGASNYSQEFQDRYFRAQADRMNRLIDTARDKLNRMAAKAYPYPDDDVIVIPRGGNPGSGPGASAALFIAQPDIAAVNSTTKPTRLLRNDGSIVSQVIKSVYVADPKLSQDNLRFGTGTKVYTLRSFLSANAIRAKHAISDIDFCSTNNSTVCAIQSITVPVLFAAMGAHYFIRDNEQMFELSASKDKDFITIEGAVHGFTPCTRCETTPGQYSNSVKNLFDYIAKWLNDRYR